MKVKCVRLTNAFGQEVESSSWLTIGRVYHVLTITTTYREMWYGIVTSEKADEWPLITNHEEKCFEIISTIVPSNWHIQIRNNGIISIAPKVWLESNFFKDFADHELSAYPIFEQEREIILKEDP
jgi:hypothetical protein